MAKVKKFKSPTAKVSSSSKSSGAPGLNFSNIESQIENFVTKTLPPLPEKAIEILVQLSPWFAVLGVILGVPTIMTLLGFSRAAAYYQLAGIGLGWGYQVSNILFIIQMVLSALAIQGLFARKLSAWRLMYYSAWVSIVANLISGEVLGMLIGGLLSFYILFQVKKAYK